MKPFKLKHRVFVSEALISEIKQHFGTSALDAYQSAPAELADAISGEDVTPLVVEKAGELFGE